MEDNKEFNVDDYISRMKSEITKSKTEATYWALAREIEESKFLYEEFRAKRAMLAFKMKEVSDKAEKQEENNNPES